MYYGTGACGLSLSVIWGSGHYFCIYRSCPKHQYNHYNQLPVSGSSLSHVPSIIWDWSDWTQAGHDWLCDWMAFVSVSPWWTVSGPGGQTSDPDESHDVCPAHARGVMLCESVLGPLQCFVSLHVSACLWTRTLTFRGVQVVSREWLRGDWIIVTMMARHRGQLVAGKLCQCLDNDNVVSDDPGMCHTLICHFILTDIWSRQWHAGRQRDLILSTIYCYFKIF